MGPIWDLYCINISKDVWKNAQKFNGIPSGT